MSLVDSPLRLTAPTSQLAPGHESGGPGHEPVHGQAPPRADSPDPPDPRPGAGVPVEFTHERVAADQVPVVLFTADPHLSIRVEALGWGVGVDVRTFAQPQRLHPPPQLMLFGLDAVAAMTAEVTMTQGIFRDIDPDRLVSVAAGDFPTEGWEQSADLGIEVGIVLPEDETWLVTRLLTAVMGPVPAGGRVVGVTGGRGGAGASVLAAALARTAAAARLRCVLVDADPLGGGSDLLLGAEEEPGLRWPELQAARGELDVDDLVHRLPLIDGVHVVSWNRRRAGPVPPAAMRAVVDTAIRMADFVVIDIPRALDQAATVALQACQTVLLVVPAEIQASAAAARSAEILRRWASDVRLVVRGPAPGRIDPRGIARGLELPLAGWLRPDRGLAAALDRGEPPALRHRGPLAGLCRELVAELAMSGPAGPRSRRGHGHR
jgi:secretion/DNA translocation related CpaE-like protein